MVLDRLDHGYASFTDALHNANNALEAGDGDAWFWWFMIVLSVVITLILANVPPAPTEREKWAIRNKKRETLK